MPDMRYTELRILKEKLYFTLEELQELLGIRPESARVFCSRYSQKGIFIRLKKNLYTLNERWEHLSSEDHLRISNVLQVPSYISFMTALSLYEVTTQVQRDFFESASLKRTVRFDIKGKSFNYYKLQNKFYSGFVRKNDIFIATMEKAFVDIVYLYSFGKYRADFSSLNLDRLDKDKIVEILMPYPDKTKDIVYKLCKI